MNLKSFFTAHWEYLAVKTACEANLFDLIIEGFDSLEKIVEKQKLDRDFLNYLLQALDYLDFIEYKDVLKLKEKGHILTENHPKSLKYSCILWAEEHLCAWQNLSFSLKIGKPYFEMQGEDDYFSFIENNPNELKIYHKAMYEYARDDYETLPKIIDFSVHKSILDIGGGLGALLEHILKKTPNVKCYLFDKEEVIGLCKNNSFEKITGNFFYKIPKIADAIILSRVIHDWDDEQALIILKNCFDALPENGTLYLIENYIDTNNKSFALLNLNMKLLTYGKERKLSEYQKLIENVGFHFVKTLKLNELQNILIFYKK